MDLGKAFKRYGSVVESFVHKTCSKKNTDLISEPSFVPDNGVYILHETLGVRTVDSWNPRNNYGVVGVLVVENDHKIVIATEDSPEDLPWSKKRGLINQPVDELEDAESDFNGEYYCRKLNSPDFPAAYYCKTYNKGNRDWYLPSSGELMMIYRHLDEIQNALSIVGGQKFVTNWVEGIPTYWSSTEYSAFNARPLPLNTGSLHYWYDKVSNILKVRPVSKFGPSKTLKESFTKKISSKKNTDLVSEPSFILDNGVYILHETLGVRGVEGWNPKFNKGVVGVLLIEDDHKIVVALEESPEGIPWSNEYELINQPVDEFNDAKSDFNGEEHCRKLNSPDFPAAYYCLNYKKDGRDWYLPSMGELWLIYRHLEEIQTALSIVGGQKFVTTWDDGAPFYWSSTEYNATRACPLNLSDGYLGIMGYKVSDSPKVRPVSNFRKKNTLKESFTRKISSKKNDELTIKADTAFVPDGVYILHQTLGVRTVDSWNPKNNDGVVGILLVEDEHKIVVATEDAPNKLYWSKKCKLNNEPICAQDEAASDFNGEYYCQNLKDSDCFAVYYCKTYNKGNRSWYLPSSGELWMIYNHLEEIQNALETVGGQKFATEWNDGVYWSSTERNYLCAWSLHLSNGNLNCIGKYLKEFHVRPVSKFGPSKTLKESFTRKISSKKNDELTIKADTAFVPDGVYILHETLGLKGVDGWNPKNNNGVVGILLVEDDHKIVVALEDAPENLHWSKKRGLINQPVDELEDAESDFNGEIYCRRLNSPDFPAAYYCLNYKKGGRSWYLPSSGELWLIYNHLEEIQNAVSIVGGQKFVTSWDKDVPVYWSSTEDSAKFSWRLDLDDVHLRPWNTKVSYSYKVRPVSAFSV